MQGLMMDMPLLISDLIRHADRHHGSTEIVSRPVEGGMHRYSYRDAHARARRLANALKRLGVGMHDRVATPRPKYVTRSLSRTSPPNSPRVLTSPVVPDSSASRAADPRSASRPPAYARDMAPTGTSPAPTLAVPASPLQRAPPLAQSPPSTHRREGDRPPSIRVRALA